MKFWIDAQLSPALAPWLAATFQVEAVSLKFIGLRDSDDRDIFEAAREADAVLVSKDYDFVDLVERYGPPPHVLWITFGNTTNARLRAIFMKCLPIAIRLIEEGEPLVEISEPAT